MLKKLPIGFLTVLFAFVIAACGADDSGASDDVEADDNETPETDFPENSVELIVPHDAGGGTDAVARALADATEEHLGESIGVINVAGGGGAVGMTEGATAAPDGYTVTLVTVELVALPHLGLAEISHEDYRPIAQINFDPPALTVPADAPYDTLEEFLDHARENPGEIQMGNGGNGNIWHLSASAIEQVADVEFEHVPFDGANSAVTSLLGGHIDAVPVSPAEVLPQVESGDLKTLAIMDDERADVMPDVPTFEEEGVTGTPSIGPWRGLTVPADTPDEVVDALSAAFMEAAEEPEFEEFMENNGLGMAVTDGDDFAQLMDEDYEFYGDLISDIDFDD